MDSDVVDLNEHAGQVSFRRLLHGQQRSGLEPIVLLCHRVDYFPDQTRERHFADE